MNSNLNDRWIPKGAAEIAAPDGLACVAYLYGFDRGNGPKIAAVGYGGKRSKPDWHYTFKDASAARQHVAKWFENQQEHLKQKAELLAGRKFAAHPLCVGTILHYSWGYDQTQCEYYEVIESKAKSVVIREIACEAVEGSQGFMSEMQTPKPGHFVGERMIKTVQARTYAGNQTFHLSMDHGTATRCGADAKHYCSWYA